MSRHSAPYLRTLLSRNPSGCRRISSFAYTLAVQHHISNPSDQIRSYHSSTKCGAEYRFIDPLLKLEEELLRNYRAQDYYPVHIGDTLHQRYKVIGKLGFGTTSPVWLCRDLLGQTKYVAVKVYVNRSKVPRELPIHQHINKEVSERRGRKHVRSLLDCFEIKGPDGMHTCVVHHALGMNMEELQELLLDETFSSDLIRQVLREIIPAMHFLHTEARVVHTDIQPKNILLGTLDEAAFERFERDELRYPMSRKELATRTIYLSQPMPLTKGSGVLCDLGEARLDSLDNRSLVMPDLYRAPEVVLCMPWSFPVDTWAFVMTLWELFQPRRLFAPQDADRQYSEQIHLAQMVAVMGDPPLDSLHCSEKSRFFWDLQGHWRGEVPIPPLGLGMIEQQLQGEERRLFLLFTRKMLQWRPEDRSGLEDVLMDEWLLADLIESGEMVRDWA